MHAKRIHVRDFPVMVIILFILHYMYGNSLFRFGFPQAFPGYICVLIKANCCNAILYTDIDGAGQEKDEVAECEYNGEIRRLLQCLCVCDNPTIGTYITRSATSAETVIKCACLLARHSNS